MDAYLAIVSKRDERSFDPRPVADDALERILEAGRMAGSAHNGQPVRFLVVEDRDVRSQLAVCAFSPGLVVLAPLLIVISARTDMPRFAGFDAGRAAQNMVLAAWSEGIASCPAGFHDAARAAVLLGLADGEPPVAAVCFGYPRTARDPARRPVADWIRRAHRRPLAEVVRRLGGAAR